ncbi:Uncharacterized membrane protein [Chryseobacterium sp. RU33C]|nr:Uncharacterized membrane protein [Chryseobacterium sp. RU33C]
MDQYKIQMRFLRKLTQHEDNLFTICKLLFNILEIKVTNTSLKDKINNHTYFPSLLTITDTLNTFGVSSAAIKMGNNHLEDFQTPFLIPIQKKGWDQEYITIINKISSNLVIYYDPVNLKWKEEKKEIFEKWTSNKIILFEKKDFSGEKDFNQKKQYENNKRAIKALPLIAFLFLAITNIIILNYTDLISVYGYFFLSLSIVGFAISFLIISYEIDSQNPFLRKVCSGIQSVNCGAVLKSQGATFYGLEWSVLGLCYFASGLFTLFLFGLSNFSVINILSFFSILASFYIFYSLYYQFKIIKQWCLLCLVIQIILFMQVTLAFQFYYTHLELLKNTDFQIIIKILLIYSVLSLISITFFPIIKNYKLTDKYRLRWKRLKANTNVFYSILSQQKKIQYFGDIGIVLGNPNAKNEIIKVCNPYCSPCANAHPILENILNQNNDVKLRIIFTASDYEHDIKAKPVKHFMALAEKKITDMHNVLNDWYVSKEINKDYNIFSQKYPLTNKEINEQGHKLSAMSEWCDKVDIKATPTIYINGYELNEDVYSINDLEDIFAN